MKRFFAKLFRRPGNPARHYAGFPIGHDVISFRENESLVMMAREWRNTALASHIFSVLHNSIPSGYPERGKEVNPTMAAIELGRVQGYLDCVNLLYALTVPVTKPTEVPIDYGFNDLLIRERDPAAQQE